jgi:hypothetical protein
MEKIPMSAADEREKSLPTDSTRLTRRSEEQPEHLRAGIDLVGVQVDEPGSTREVRFPTPLPPLN